MDEPGLTVRIDGVDGSGGSKMSFTVSGLNNSVNVGTDVGQERDRILYDGPYVPGSYRISVTATEREEGSDDEYTEGSADLGVDLSSLKGQASVTITQKPGDKDDKDVDDDDPNAPDDPDEQASYTISLVAEVTPAVNVLEADVQTDRITVDCQPPGPSGLLRITLKGLEGASKELYYQSFSGGPVTISFGLDLFNPAQKEMTFTNVEASWEVAGNTVTGVKYLDPPFEYLGVWKITNYFTPQESGFAGATLSKGTGNARLLRNGTVDWSNLRNVSHPIDFMNAVDPANEGLGLIGTTVVRFRRAGRNTSATPWTGLHNDVRYYLAYPDPDQQTASCPPNSLIGTTDTFASISRKLRCGAKIMIHGVQGVLTKRDIGQGLIDEQIDIYIGEGGSALQARAQAWGERHLWVINLLY